MTSIKARDLSIGHVFKLNLFGEVVEASSVCDGKRVKIKILLREQATGLEFLDAGCAVEFICKSGRVFHVYDDDGDDDDEREPEFDPTPDPPVLVDA